MPWGVAAFLVYAFLILIVAGLSLGAVVDRAILVPITFEGVVLMALLAYTIFTTTLVLQRKIAGRNLALGLATLMLPAIPFAIGAKQPFAAGMILVFAALLWRGLRTPAARAWLNEE
jgi:hypothetical protein